MKKYIDMGFYIGITGWICDTRRNTDLKDAVKELPLDKIMIETDSPWLIPYDYMKYYNTKRNESDSLEYVVSYISKYTDISKDDIITNSTQNAKKLFNI